MDVLELDRAPSVEPSSVRLLTERDIAWMADLGKRRYSNAYDFRTVEGWFTNIVLKSPLAFLPIRTDSAFCIALLSTTPWAGGSECNIALLCADHNSGWQAMTLLKATIDWARQRKASVWRIASETEFDLGPLALRLGAKEQTPRYNLEL